MDRICVDIGGSGADMRTAAVTKPLNVTWIVVVILCFNEFICNKMSEVDAFFVHYLRYFYTVRRS